MKTSPLTPMVSLGMSHEVGLGHTHHWPQEPRCFFSVPLRSCSDNLPDSSLDVVVDIFARSVIVVLMVWQRHRFKDSHLQYILCSITHSIRSHVILATLILPNLDIMNGLNKNGQAWTHEAESPTRTRRSTKAFRVATLVSPMPQAHKHPGCQLHNQALHKRSRKVSSEEPEWNPSLRT